MDFSSPTVNAPEFPEKLTWLNTEPLTMEELKGKVVLIDFWTYSCINCQRTLPYLKKWWNKYQDSGLVIIGVHTPEFDFEKEVQNVKKALRMYEVTWPILLDNNMQTWQAYANHYWPAKYLINHEGKIIYTHFGEGNYVETEIKIQEALRDGGFQVLDQFVMADGHNQNTFDQTPELYFGSLRGRVENIKMDRPSLGFQPNQVYTTGKWIQKEEYLQHGRETKDLDDLVILSFRAREVFLVMSTEEGQPLKVYVTLDGVGLSQNNCGKDIQFDSEGRSFVEVTLATLYNLVSTSTFGDHILRLSTTSDQLRLFAYTFGS